MRKQVIKVGGESLGIRFTKREREIYGISEGDIINLEDMIILKEKLK